MESGVAEWTRLAPYKGPGGVELLLEDSRDQTVTQSQLNLYFPLAESGQASFAGSFPCTAYFDCAGSVS